jgi:hypothetical protein
MLIAKKRLDTPGRHISRLRLYNSGSDGLGRIERETINRLGLDLFDLGQNFVAPAELAILDRLLRLRL